MQRRREFLQATGAALAAVGLAGCSDSGGTTDGDATTAADAGSGNDGGDDVGVDAAVAAQWNVYRARLADAAALGAHGASDVGAQLAATTFEQDFENAGGEHGAHETLETTSESAYEGFEQAAIGVRDALREGDSASAIEQAESAAANLRDAQQRLVGETAMHALDALAFADHAATARALAAAGQADAAAVAANTALSAFETAPAHEAMESAATDAYESFESGLGDTLSAGQRGNADDANSAAATAVSAAVDGAYAIADTAGTEAGHIASLQSRAYDAAALNAMGGPSSDFGHAAVLSAYRARAQDAAWVADAGASDAAASMAISVLEDFEGAAAHEPLEETDHDAYEGFEGGVEALQEAITAGSGVSDALSQVDTNLVAGIKALTTDTEAVILETGFLRALLGDAREQYQRGNAERAAASVEAMFKRFERDELGAHETLESTSESLYETFEDEHVGALPAAMRNGNDDAVTTHLDGARSALAEFAAQIAPTARVAGGESVTITARAFDAAGVAALDDRTRAATVADDAMAYFEGGAGGFHEAVEASNEETYHAFEEALVGVSSTASDGGSVFDAATGFGAQSRTAVYDVIGNAGGDLTAAAAAVARGALRDFEGARAHEPLEEADHDAYEAFESSFETYASGLESGTGDVSVVRRASLRAQFAVAGDASAAPVGDAASSSEGDSQPELSGGPNVVSGVPDDADHVIDMNAVAYDPAELTVSAGDTVAWTHADGEAHSVTAYEDDIPADAAYWASGGFDSQDAAKTGWANGKGAVTEGESYVHTFETTGEHEYYCIPHKNLGMEGTIVVEE
ncbi:DUF5059 domain-containing protein [Halobacterium salinarum]|uniref:DUF5059 domain-containing protein n=1 Tax=Halobacterium salinarum TaxID=2242 RepID=UPI003904D770